MGRCGDPATFGRDVTRSALARPKHGEGRRAAGGRSLGGVQVQARYREPIEAGEVTLLFRRWKRSQVVAGRTYRTAAGRLEVTAVDEVDPAAVTDAEARRAGAADAEALRAELRGEPGWTTYRLAVRPATGPDPRAELAADDALTDAEVAEVDRRLDRLDRASSWGPWTAATLRLVEASPATLAAELAASVGRERDPFKLDVRKLKALGLTESLAVGYRLSPRGRAYLARTTRPG